MTIDPKRICIVTLAIGPDYRRNLEKALTRKKEYAEKHGYTYIQAQEEWWNRDRPIAWSKVPLWIDLCQRGDLYDYIWISDADVYITNMDLKLEDHVIPRLESGKDLLLTFDTCGHINSGNMIVRPGEWAKDFFRNVWNQEDCINHIWWENAAMVKLLGSDPSYGAKVTLLHDAYIFNAYLMGLPDTRLWQPGDFLVHFAGVYKAEMMAKLMDMIDRGKVPRIDMYNGQLLSGA
jgi:hypothetical protein